MYFGKQVLTFKRNLPPSSSGRRMRHNDDGSSTFIQNVGSYLPKHKAFHVRRQYPIMVVFCKAIVQSLDK
jgi:hypothetical protein